METGDFVRATIGAGVRVRRDDARPWTAALARVPAVPSVVAFEDDTGATVLLGATADARAFSAKRLGAPDGARADLSGVCRGLVVAPVASGFDAELVYLAMARERMPRVYRQLMARGSPCVVKLDAAARFPEPQAMELAEARGDEPGCLLGPVLKKHASRLAEAVVDAFDLCRYPHILRQAPGGVACAYKEMGRCPAPCDGSETLEAYRARVAEAVRSVGLPASQREAGVLAAMRDAVAGARFEEAAQLHKVRERFRTLDAGGIAAGTFDAFRHIVVTATGATDKEPRLSGWSGGRCVGVGTWSGTAEALVGSVADTAVCVPETPAELEAVMVLARWAQEQGGRRRVRVVRVSGADDAATVVEAVRAVVSRRAGGGTGGGKGGGAGEVEEVEHRDAVGL
jgi:hypothetical protein